MGWAEIIYRCGHSNRIQAYGEMRKRKFYLQSMRNRWCPECFLIITEASRQARTKLSIKIAQEHGLPDLIGSDKQIAWAATIRRTKLDAVQVEVRKAELEAGANDARLESLYAAESAYAELAVKDMAKWWIDHRDYSLLELCWLALQLVTEAQLADNHRPPGEDVNGQRVIDKGGQISVDGQIVSVDADAWAFAQMVNRGTMKLTVTHPDLLREEARALIAKALKRSKHPYIAYSGGKDSTVVAALVHEVDASVPLVWSDDELEYPEIVGMMTEAQADTDIPLIVTLGWAQHAGWFRPWTDRPYFRQPLPGAQYVGKDVDDYMGEHGYDLVFTGLRADESKVRAVWLETQGPLYHVKGGSGTRCCPIWDWLVGEVWREIDRSALAYCAAYDTLAELGVGRQRQRMGPLPLSPRSTLAAGWPDLLIRLESRYGNHWS